MPHRSSCTAARLQARPAGQSSSRPARIVHGAAWRTVLIAAASGASRAAPKPQASTSAPTQGQTRLRFGGGCPWRRSALPEFPAAGPPRRPRVRGSGAPGRSPASRGHLRVHLLHGGSKVLAQGVQAQGGITVHAGRPARAHGRAVQGGALAGAAASEDIFGIALLALSVATFSDKGARMASSASATPLAMARLPQTRTRAPWASSARMRSASRRRASRT